MFSIGDFSRLARVSCRLLRYYDEIGLLRPATVDRHTGYRYYSATQLPHLNRILVLKELGFSLEEIARLIDENVPAAELRGMLSLRRSEVARAVAAETQRLRQLETRIAQIDDEGKLSVDDVIIREEPSRRFLCVRDTIPSFSAARALLQTIVANTRQVPSEARGPLMAIAHALEFEPNHIDVQIGLTLLQPFEREVRLPERGTMQIEELPAVAYMATCVRIGTPEHAHLVTGRIAHFVAANGYRLAGPSREVFLEPPRFEHMDQAVVEMQYPIEKVTALATSST